MENACVYNKTFDIIPINYRTHSHNLGYVTSGYVIRNKEWIELGRMSPKQPQV